MQKVNRYLSLFLFFFFTTVTTNAQGWLWGTGSYNPGLALENGPMAADKYGNVFVSAYVLLDTFASPVPTQFGSIIVPNMGGKNQLLVVKANSAGGYSWVKATQNVNAYPEGIVTDDAGDLYLLGVYDSVCTLDGFTLTNPGTSWMYFIAKFDSSGTVLWAKNVLAVSATSINGSMGVDGAGNVFITGIFSDNTDTIGASIITNSGPGTTDVFVAKYNGAGNPIWAKSFGGIYMDYVNGLTVSPSGSVYVAGRFTSPSVIFATDTLTTSDFCLYAMKYDNNGNQVWARGTAGNSNCGINSITTDIEGGLYMAGTQGMDTMRWGTTQLILSGNLNPFLVKYDSSGNVSWARTATGGSNQDYAWSVSVDSCKNAWIYGQMQDTMAFDGHVLPLPSIGNEPAFIVEYNNEGNYVDGMTLPNGGEDGGGIAVDNKGNFYLGGDYLSDTLFANNDTLLLAGGLENLYILKYHYNISCATLSNNGAQQETADIIIYPNPAEDEFTIKSRACLATGSRADIYDVTGRLLRSVPLTGYNTSISLAGISPGIYQCRIHNNKDNETTVKKLIVVQ